MTAAEIRNQFLEFFRNKGHQIVPSAPIVVKNDPTLMFTNAGMNQFKDYFLGNKTPIYRRIADTQKCLRVSGKHNDLEEVGLDTYHHTMFEMLGNWSFGDYFKKEAIAWSWELLTEVYNLPKSKLYATVFEGDAGEGLPADDESFQYWQQFLPTDHILYGNKKDNFWEMGDTGPCGPCTEIHIDLRSDEEIAQNPGRNLINAGHPQVVEIWNNVFIEFNRLSNGSLQPLPDKHVDTGMGFERLCMAIQKKISNYDTDVFTPTIQFVEAQCGIKYGGAMSMQPTDIAMRVLADHIRAICFTIADGQLPSNNKAGYVIRRILRRAVRYYFNFLNIKTPFLTLMVHPLAEQFKDVFPELYAQKDFVAKVILEEENAFLKTLDTGLKRLALIMEKAESKIISGKTAFELFDTYGFPYDLTALIARENGFEIDEAAFQQELMAQKERSRKATSVESGDWVVLNNEAEQSFIGYDTLQSTTTIIKYRPLKDKNRFQVVLEECPFYGESGGQVGDKGWLSVAETNAKATVLDAKKENDLIVLLCETAQPDAIFKSGILIHAEVDSQKRSATAANHTATHLLHAALRKKLGTHVQQKGSLVSDALLRFDFSHFAKVTDEELSAIEAEVNEKIRANIALEEQRNVPIAEAQKLGAMALFGEKYGDFVRVITFDKNYSVELCGGTHVQATGEIRQFKLLSESSVAAGVRRIEALTGTGAEQYISTQLAQLKLVKELLQNPKDVVKSVQDLIDNNHQLQKKIEQIAIDQKNQEKTRLKALAQEFNQVTVIIAEVSLMHAEAVRQLCFELKAEYTDLFMVVGALLAGKPHLAVMLSDSVIAKYGLNASTIARELGKEIKGGGGGQPFFATAGGQDPNGLTRALQKAATYLK
jgi:alanyl-tRNA synthetase